MGRSWYRTDPERLEQLRRRVEQEFPEIRLIRGTLPPVFAGTFPVSDGNNVLDRYQVEIELHETEPNGLPIVRETKERIPRDPDRHMESDGKACIVLPDAYWHENPEGMDLVGFMTGPMRSYFASQSLLEKDQTNAWPDGEWQHGADGVFEFYRAILGFKDPMVIRNFLSTLARGDIKGHWPCPCRSGAKIRTCHRELIRSLRDRIPTEVAAYSEKLASQQLIKSMALRNTS